MYRFLPLIASLLIAAPLPAQRILTGKGQTVDQTTLASITARARVDRGITVDGTLIIPASELEFIGDGYLEGPATSKVIVRGTVIADPFAHIFRGEMEVKLDRGYANMHWFGGKDDARWNEFTRQRIDGTYTKNAHPLRKAQWAVYPRGTVEINKGVYEFGDTTEAVRYAFAGLEFKQAAAVVPFFTSFRTGPAIVYDSVEVVGQGMGQTVLIRPAADELGRTLSGVDYSPTRSGGHLDGQAEYDFQATFEDGISVGQVYLDVRTDTMATRFNPGMRVCVRNGGNGFDQDKKEYKIVERVVGRRIFFTEPFYRDMSIASASVAGQITSGFTMPAEGDTVHVDYIGSGNQPLGGGNQKTFSVGNNYLAMVEEIDVDDNENGRFAIMNIPGFANDTAGTVFPPNSVAYKARIMFPATTSTRGAWVKNCTILAGRHAWTISNFYDCGAENVEMIHDPDATGGLMLNGDGGINFDMNYCVNRTVTGEFGGSQLARSITNFRSYRTEWHQVKHTAIEFTEGASFIEDKFYFDVNTNQKPDGTGNNPIGLFAFGPTGGRTSLIDCEYYMDGGDNPASSLFTSTDVGKYTSSNGGGVRIINGYADVTGVNTLISVGVPGLVIDNLRARGRIISLFGDLGAAPHKDSLQAVVGFSQNSVFGGTGYADYGLSKVNIDFNGRVDQIYNSTLVYAEVTGSVTRTGSGLGDTIAINDSRVVDGSLISKSTLKDWEGIFYVSSDLTVTGWPIINNVPADKGTTPGEAPLSGLSRYTFRMLRPMSWTKNGDGSYTYLGALEDHDLTIDGN